GLVPTPGDVVTGPLLATTGPVTVSTTLGGATLTVTYTENVYSDPLGLCPGCLDFVIFATNDAVATGGFAASNVTIEHITTGNYAVLTGAADLDMGWNTVEPGTAPPLPLILGG